MNRRKLVIILSALVVIILIIAGWLILHKPTSNRQVTTASNSGAQPLVKNDNGSTANSAKSTTSASQASGAPIAAPTGDFVSNHRPKLSSTSLSQEVSVCVTNVGAACEISFTQNGITKSLGFKTADSNGNVSWNWSVDNLGLTPGSWTITATAKQGNQTNTATDSLPLSVQS